MSEEGFFYDLGSLTFYALIAAIGGVIALKFYSHNYKEKKKKKLI